MRNLSTRSATLLSLTALAACALPMNTASNNSSTANDWSKHVIASNKLGQFDEQAYRDGAPCRGQESFERCQLDLVISSIRTRLDQNEHTRLVIFIHGGLNSPKDAMGRAEAQAELILKDGDYPIFLNWQSGLLPSYVDQIWNVRSGERVDIGNGFHNIQRAAFPLYLVQDVVAAVARAPAAWFGLTYTYFETVREERRPQLPQQVPANVTICSGTDRASAGVSAIDAVQLAAALPGKVVSTPFVDSMGNTSWDNMRRVARATMRKELSIQQDIDEKYPLGDGPFARFANELERLLDTNFGSQQKYSGRVSVTIIAHSMGTMIANELIRDFALRYKEIVYMGAATSIRDFYDSVVPYLRSNGNHRFYNLMLHPAEEAREAALRYFLPDGSLLEWIDRMFQHSESPMDRTFGKANNALRVLGAFPPQARDKMNFRVFDEGAASTAVAEKPVRHGDFSKVLGPAGGAATFKFWQKKYWDSCA